MLSLSSERKQKQQGVFNMHFFENIRQAFSAELDDNKDRADLVQTVILTAGFAIVSFVIVNFVGTALINKGADLADCIEGSSTYQTEDSIENCETVNHAEENGTSFKDGTTYTGRFGE